jgi:L-amino acid N-acyltransferase YncA
VTGMRIRPADDRDHKAIWAILEPIIRTGETYALPPDMTAADALAYWCGPGHSVFVAEQDGQIIGTYYLRANQQGGGAHVANCGYMSDPSARGRGVGRAMAEHSLVEAKTRGFRAIQFNFVVSSNEGAIRLWHGLGFSTLCRLLGAFRHPRLGFVDALVMYRELTDVAGP